MIFCDQFTEYWLVAITQLEWQYRYH